MLDPSSVLLDPRAPEARQSCTRMLLRRISTSNPFYVLSALLVFVGLRISFDPGSGRLDQTSALALGLVGYTLLLAVSAGMLVRLGNVWEDVRTLLLLVVFFFLVVSTSFDGILATDLRRGVACNIAGWVFAIVVSEALLRGTRLGLPLLFRIPYHLILALFFLYPIALAPHLRRPESLALQWGLFGFALTAGIAFLSLLPAIRRGPEYMKSSSPWRWPMYPWALFVFLAGGVCLRAWYLCGSMHHLGYPNGGQSIFGLYFLAPFLIVISVLLLEIGIVSRIPGVVGIALASPLGVLGLSAVGHEPDGIYRRFLTMYTETLGGTPLYVMLLVVIAFYIVAATRRIPGARAALLLTIATMAVIDPQTLGFNDLSSPHPWPIFEVGCVLLVLGWRSKGAWRLMLGAACVVVALMVGPDSLSPGTRGLLGFHFGVGLVLCIGASWQGVFARTCQRLGAVSMGIAGLMGSLGDGSGMTGIPEEWIRAYPLFVASGALAYGAYVRSQTLYRISASVSLAGLISGAGWRAYGTLRPLVSGLDQIALGLAFLAVAWLISLSKAGLLQRWYRRWGRRIFEAPG
jgi:hypothetical protein